MLLCGAVIVALGLFAVQRHRAATDWPRTPELICEIVSERHFKDND